jgi:hypothetical protein
MVQYSESPTSYFLLECRTYYHEYFVVKRFYSDVFPELFNLLLLLLLLLIVFIQYIHNDNETNPSF